ncbi:glycosyltransferase [Candidatus Woesearchaeota archaeon]|nr:glycosyltransferase [Candidatus Woesearchaeota archaeon]
MASKQPLVSIVIPSYNAHKKIASVLDAIIANNYPHLEVIVIDDNSADHTLEIVETYQHKLSIKIIKKPKSMKKGAAISTNLGIKKAKGEIVCSIDSDAVISNNWIKEVVKQFRTNRKLGAVAGYIYTGNKENLWANFMGAELEDRYDNITSDYVEHISTCNTAYRKKALEEVGLFDEKFYYGYDVDLSYKLRKKGYQLKLLKTISCEHYWKETLGGYLKQQYDVAYARLQLLNKYPQKKTGDDVANWFMFMQVPLTGLFYAFLGLGLLFYLTFGATTSSILMKISLIPLAFLMLLEIPQTLRILIKREDVSFILFPLFILLRNTAWCYAAARYVMKLVF